MWNIIDLAFIVQKLLARLKFQREVTELWNDREDKPIYALAGKKYISYSKFTDYFAQNLDTKNDLALLTRKHNARHEWILYCLRKVLFNIDTTWWPIVKDVSLYSTNSRRGTPLNLYSFSKQKWKTRIWWNIIWQQIKKQLKETTRMF